MVGRAGHNPRHRGASIQSAGRRLPASVSSVVDARPLRMAAAAVQKTLPVAAAVSMSLRALHLDRVVLSPYCGSVSDRVDFSSTGRFPSAEMDLLMVAQPAS